MPDTRPDQPNDVASGLLRVRHDRPSVRDSATVVLAVSCITAVTIILAMPRHRGRGDRRPAASFLGPGAPGMCAGA